VQRLNLHGLHFQHVALCPRRAWMYLHRINFAQWHQRVAAGAALHATSYACDRSGKVCLLSETGRRHVAEQFSALLETSYLDRPYREWIYREALGVEREVLDMAEYQSFKRKA